MVQRKRVLVIDDDPVSLSVAKAVLEDLGYDVSTRDRPLGTAMALYRERPDIVLIDVSMPTVSGDELVRLSKNNPALKDTLFILFSGNRAADLERLVSETGATGAIAKTGDLKAFADAFQRLVGQQTHSEPPAKS